jgi:hypothetical protein
MITGNVLIGSCCGIGKLNYDYYKNRSLEYIEGELNHLDRSYRSLVRVGDNKGAESNRQHTLKLREIYNAKKNK